MLNIKKKIGIVLIFLSILFSTNPFGVLPAIPIYLIGILLIWKSTSSKKLKYWLTILPLVIWYPLLHLSMQLNPIIGMQLAQKLEFRFDKEFRGRVIIVSPVQWGQEVFIENGREVININESGFVYYQGNIEDGYTNWKYVSISESGEVIDIDEFRSWEMTDSEKKLMKPDSLGVIEGGGWSATSFSPEPMVEYNVRSLWLNEWSNRNSQIYDVDSISKIIEDKLRTCKSSRNN